jgi:hypothetical protein
MSSHGGAQSRFIDIQSFDVSFLDMMLRCQLSGFPVLEQLLIFQTDVALYEYAKNEGTRPPSEAQFFIASVISLLNTYVTFALLQPYVGALLLIAFTVDTEQEKFILMLVAIVFVDPSLNSSDIIAVSINFQFLPRMFEFARLKNCPCHISVDVQVAIRG